MRSARSGTFLLQVRDEHQGHGRAEGLAGGS